MFSPSYFRARRQQYFPDPDAHTGINIAVYGPKPRWAFTEPGRQRSRRTAEQLQLSGSSLRWRDGSLEIAVRERTAGIGRPIEGVVRLTPSAAGGAPTDLDGDARHQWWCVAPGSRIDVDLPSPGVRWQGSGYFDSNFGREPLESAFRRWSWSRAETPAGTAVLYDAELKDGTKRDRALLFAPDGSVASWHPEQTSELEATRWRLPRSIRSDDGTDRVEQTLEDTPFYSRSLVRTRQASSETVAMHETLDLTRYAHPLVQLMVPFRLRRGWRA